MKNQNISYHQDAYLASFEVGETQVIDRRPTMIFKNDRDNNPVEKIAVVTATFCRFDEVAEGEYFTFVHDERAYTPAERNAVRLTHPVVPFRRGKVVATSKWPMRERVTISKVLKPETIVAKIASTYEA